MARLNDPPAPAESVESLKKRFIRQNRELAKTNSTQSIRIRNLESETSRLLTENLSLRSQIAHLETTVSDLQSTTAATALHTTRSLLESKLSELSSLICTLGQPDHTRPARRRSSYKPLAEKPSPTARQQWREETQMPTIVEGKYFPRWTMDAGEMLALQEQELENERQQQLQVNFLAEGSSQDSPDLGPPPVAHFDEVGPIGFDPGREATAGVDGAGDEEEVKLATGALGVNLETRRRRRESGKIDVRRLTVFLEKESGDGEIGERRKEGDASGAVQQVARPGKRKFGSGDSETGLKTNNASHPTPSQDEFRFNRKSQADTPAAPENREIDSNEDLAVPLRRVLKNKSTNDDIINSPKKLRGSILEGKPTSNPTVPTLTTRKPALSARETAARSRLTPKSRDPPSLPARRSRAPDPSQLVIPEPIPLPTTQPQPSPAVTRIDPPTTLSAPLHSTEKSLDPLPPKTPFLPSDLLSPLTDTSDPSARDTPPPGDLGFSSASRPSRRARPQVNYAEPSLNKKMRRAGEKVDAVAAGANGLRDSSASESERRSVSTESERKERKVCVKWEDEVDEGWRDFPDVTDADGGKTKLEKLAEAEAQAAVEAVEQATAECRAGSPLGRKTAPTRGKEPGAAKMEDGKPLTTVAAVVNAARKRREQAAGGRGSGGTRPRSSRFHYPVASTKSDETNEREKDPLAVFEFTDSSSPPRPLGAPAATPGIQPSGSSKGRVSRRHSSMAGLSNDATKGGRSEPSRAPSSRTTRERPSSRTAMNDDDGGKISTRRRSMLL
ncbi:hypothetical protein P152DRAFT_483441 [Eremomyces bilateralis CBS 781.70]|uniref:Shugoshin n=1 Tax=Eremomyces bilateralis CBS 781.70 TaxID=1392243 RepID=A0A6G1FZB5_9PEZI|nr:uncharacterized protein P152DRAFT_483441 [Eremomyces bilateralis CBS 781.70]KAF1811134.1 hypothetical protein P152DRAFT_483441 [Eremomyces bilateralis CBS 781.70]